MKRNKHFLIQILTMVCLFLWAGISLGQTTVTSNNLTVVAIPDNNNTGASSVVPFAGIPDGAILTDIEVDLAINHTWVGDLRIQLENPDGDLITLMGRPGLAGAPGTGSCCGDSSDFSSSAPITFTDASINDPETMGATIGGADAVCAADGLCDYFPNDDSGNPQSFADFATDINTFCEPINGNWTVRLLDGAGGDLGDFFVPEIRLTYVMGTFPLESDPVITGTAGDDDFEVTYLNGAVVVYQNGVLVFGQCQAATDSVTINAGDGDDTLTIDYDNGDFDFPINFNGEGQNTTVGDILQLTGGGSFDFVTHFFTNANDGSVSVDGNSAVTYTGLEPVIDNLDAIDRTFNFTGGAETITLSAGGSLDNQIDSTLGEVVDFNNPTGSLTINAGTGADIINIEGVATGFDADLTVNGDDDDDDIIFQTNATDLGSGNLTTASEQLTVSANISTTGNLTTTSTDNTVVNNNAVVQTSDGAIVMTAGSSPAAGTNYTGLDLNAGSVEATGSGSISLTGNGFDSSNGNGRNGILIRSTSVVRTVSGDLSITGTGSTTGNQLNLGIRIDNPSLIESTDGDITLTGTGGLGTGNFNIGVAVLFSGVTVRTTGAGAIDIIGTAGDGAIGTYGVLLQEAQMSSAGGGISMLANPGTVTATSNAGIAILLGSVIEDSGSGDITMIGTASSGATGSGNGVVISNAPSSSITTVDGSITLNGTGGTGTGDNYAGTVVTSTSVVSSTGAGDINLIGASGPGANFNRGIDINGGATISANGGNISFNGTGNAAATGTFNLGTSIRNSSNVTTTGSGNITVVGTGGSGTDANYGAEVVGNASVTAQDGLISITATNTDNAGTDQIGFRLNSTISTTGTGNINISGEAGVSTSSGIEFSNNDANITAVGDVSLTTTVGPISSPSGVPGASLVTATNLVVNGALQPGFEVEGTLPVAANLALSAGDSFEPSIAGFTTPGTDYDQVSVVGTVDITDATLTLIDNTTDVATPFEILVLIDNDGTDAVVGTFNGLPNESAIAFNGETWYIYYDEGDGNDVVLRSSVINVEVDASGNLVYRDPLGEDDELTIIIDGSNYRISDPNKPVIAGQGAVQDGNDALVPIASVTAAININTQDGDDSLNVDLDGGNFGDAINYDGGNQNSLPGDIMLLSATGAYATVTHNFVNDNDGSVEVIGNSTITYTGLEPVIDNLNVADRVFNFTGGAETITLDAGGTLDNQIDSTLGESVDFNNPTNSLTINGGSGDDTINIEGVAAGFDAALVINGDDATDTINFQTNPTATTSGAISALGEQVFVTQNITTTSTIDITGSSRLQVSTAAVVESTDGDITLIGGNAPIAGDNFIGARFNGGIVRTTGAGNISVTGIGTYDGTNFRHGIEVQDAGGFETLGTGMISLTGTAADNSRSAAGIYMFEDSTVSSNGGGISLIGTGGNSSQNFNHGIFTSRVVIQDLNGGSVSLNGQANGTANTNQGLSINNSQITTTTGALSLTGVGSVNGASNNYGINMTASAALTTTSGDVTLDGTGNGGNNGRGIYITGGATISTTDGDILLTGSGSTNGNGTNYGVRVQNTNTAITTVDGTIQINGTGGGNGFGTGGFNSGVLYFNNARAEASGTGSISMTGQGGTSLGLANRGVDIESAGTIVRTNGGGITLNGTGGTGGAQAMGVILLSGPTVEDTNGGTIDMDGIAGSGTGNLYAGVIINNGSVLGTGGAILVDGTGGTGAGNLNLGARILANAQVQTTGAGVITITGTGGTGTNNNNGIEFNSGASVSVEDGDMTLTGVATDNAGNNQFGMRVRGSFTATGSGNIILTGASGPTNNRDISIEDVNTLISAANGNVTLTGLDGTGIITPSGIPPADIIAGNTITVNSALRPGDTSGLNVGLLPVAGNLQLANDDTLVFNFRDFVTAGTDYDQVRVIGTVDITDADLLLADDLASPEDACDTLVLIDNDGSDAIIGTFNGLAEGASVTFGTITGKISYIGGDGNDFTLNLDDTPPVIACPTDIIVDNDTGVCGAQVFFADAIATDACGIASVIQTAGDPSGSVFPVGVTTIEFTATDVNGNTAVCTFDITVNDVEPPVAVCQDITIQLDATGNASIVAADIDGGSTDNCGIASISASQTDFTCADVGDNNVTLTVTDVNGVSSTCIAVVTVEDVTSPVAVCMDITVELDVNGMVTIDPSDVDGGSSDACGIGSLSLDIDTFDCSNVGDNPVVLTVTDVNGNTDSCTAIVTVEDNIAPDLVCMDITVELDENGMAVITPEDVIASNTDACGINTTAVDIFEFTCDDIGAPITVTVFSVDNNANKSVCTALVTVIDALPPVVTCPADQTVDPGAGNLFYEVPDYFATAEASAVDNCSDPVTITSQDPAPGTEIPDGVYTVTLTAEDEYGNVGTCSFELTVESVLGVEDNVDLSNANIILYPNPAINQVMLSNPQGVALDEAAIYDMTGRLILTHDLTEMGTEKALDISILPTATYTVIIKGEGGFITKRLMKQ